MIQYSSCSSVTGTCIFLPKLFGICSSPRSSVTIHIILFIFVVSGKSLYPSVRHNNNGCVLRKKPILVLTTGHFFETYVQDKASYGEEMMYQSQQMGCWEMQITPFKDFKFNGREASEVIMNIRRFI